MHNFCVRDIGQLTTVVNAAVVQHYKQVLSKCAFTYILFFLTVLPLYNGDDVSHIVCYGCIIVVFPPLCSIYL